MVTVEIFVFTSVFTVGMVSVVVFDESAVEIGAWGAVTGMWGGGTDPVVGGASSEVAGGWCREGVDPAEEAVVSAVTSRYMYMITGLNTAYCRGGNFRGVLISCFLWSTTFHKIINDLIHVVIRTLDLCPRKSQPSN